MPLLDINYGEVPDQIEPIAAGVAILEVAKVPEIKPTEKGTGNMLVVEFRVVQHESFQATSEKNMERFKGRSMTDWIFLNEFGIVKSKHLIVGLGMPPSNGVNTEEMLGKKTKAIIVPATFKDESTGEVKPSAKIKDYLKP